MSRDSPELRFLRVSAHLCVSNQTNFEINTLFSRVAVIWLQQRYPRFLKNIFTKFDPTRRMRLPSRIFVLRVGTCSMSHRNILELYLYLFRHYASAFVPNSAKIAMDEGTSLSFLLVSRYAIGVALLLPVVFFSKTKFY